MEPRGRDGWAAVTANISYVSPFAVWRPSKSSPYQLETHSQTLRGFPFRLGFGVASGEDAACKFVAESDVPATGDVKGAFNTGVRKNSRKPKNTAPLVIKFLIRIFT
jgi:hypothetical protein